MMTQLLGAPRFGALLLSCALGLLAACSYIPPSQLKTPSFALSELAVKEFNSESVKLLVTVLASNQNPVDIPVSNLKLDLSMMDTAIASGVSAQPDIFIPKNGEAKVPIEFSIQPRQLMGLLRNLSLSDLGRLRYQLKGSANWNNGPFSVPFQRQGEFTGLQKFQDLLKLIAR